MKQLMLNQGHFYIVNTVPETEFRENFVTLWK